MDKQLYDMFVNKHFVTINNAVLNEDINYYGSKNLGTLKKGTKLKVIDIKDYMNIQIIDGLCGLYVQVELPQETIDVKGKKILKNTKGWIFFWLFAKCKSRSIKFDFLYRIL